MRHIVMMKLQEGCFDQEAEQEYRETFEALKEALPEDILSVRVFRNAVARPMNMDVMIEMELRDETSLPKYLKHPLHMAISGKYNPVVERIASFDSMEVAE